MERASPTRTKIAGSHGKGRSAQTHTRVLLVEDSPVFRSALVNILSEPEGRSVEAWSSSRLIASTEPPLNDLVIIDSATWTNPLSTLFSCVRATIPTSPVLL